MMFGGPDASTAPSTVLRADGWNGMTKGGGAWMMFGDRPFGFVRQGRTSLRVTRGVGLVKPAGSEVSEVRIQGFDEVELLLSPPFFKLLFTSDCGIHVREDFEVYKDIEIVRCGESGDEFGFMLGDSSFEVICEAEV
jgi:hypothetical protein